MRTLRWLYLVDGVLMVVAGLLFGSWSNSKPGMDLLGLRNPGAYVTHLPEWRAISFAGEFGGALIAFGFAALAIARSKDHHVHRSSIPFFLAAHFFLSLLVWGKQLAFGASPGGLMVLVIAVYLGVGFLYGAVAGLSPLSGASDITGDERRIRDAAGQEERNRLAQDLHDSVKQQVYAIQASLAAAQERWTTDIPAAREAVDQARSMAHDAMSEMTALLDRLRRDPVESVGLIEAIRRQTEALGYQTGATVQTHFDAMPAPSQLPSGAMTIVFRIAQEALANIARHARASHVELRAGMDDSRKEFQLAISDDGRGFDAASAADGMGLVNIRNRAAEIGGWADITSEMNRGSCVTLGVPLLDPLYDRLWRHNASLVVSMMVLVPAGLMLWLWNEARPYLLPLVALAAMLAVFHAWAVGSLRWRAG